MDTSNSKRIAKNTMYLYIRMVLTMLVSLITVRVVLNVLGVEEYGVYTSIAGVIASLSFISSVLASASQRFFSYEIGKDNEKSLNEVFGTVFITYCAVSIVIILMAETVGLWFVFNKMNIPTASVNAAHWVYQFALASFVITLIANPFQAIIISYEKMNIYAYMSIIEVIMKLGIAFLLYYRPIEKLKLYAVLMFVASLVVHLVYMGIGGKIVFKNSIKLLWSKTRFKDIFNYTSWTLFGTVAGVCNSQGLNILLNLFYGPVANAAYAISNQVSAAVNSLAANFFVAVRPPLIKSYAQKDMDSTNTLFYFSTKVVFILLFIIAVPIIYKTELILKLWLGDVSPYMVSFVRCILIYTIVMRLSDPITVILQAANQVKIYHGIVDTFTMLSLPIAYVFLKMGAEANSVFIISIIIFVIAHFIRLLILKRNFDLSVKKYIYQIILPIIISIGLSASSIFIIDLLPESTLFNFVSMGLAFLVALVIACFVMLKSNERKRIYAMIKKH